jgi:hypothetical protein
LGKIMSANECYAYFGLSGPSLNPEAVSAVLKLVPTKVERVGDMKRNGKKREEGAWQLNDRIPRDARVDYEARVKDVLDQLEPCLGAAASLCKTNYGMIMLVGYFNEYDPGLWLEADTVARIGRLGAAFHCDFYHLIEEQPNQALQHNDPSCHVSCLRTPRASRGRG